MSQGERDSIKRDFIKGGRERDEAIKWARDEFGVTKFDAEGNPIPSVTESVPMADGPTAKQPSFDFDIARGWILEVFDHVDAQDEPRRYLRQLRPELVTADVALDPGPARELLPC